MKQIKISIITTENEIVENTTFDNYEEAEDYVYKKYNCCWNFEKIDDSTYAFIIYPECVKEQE